MCCWRLQQHARLGERYSSPYYTISRWWTADGKEKEETMGRLHQDEAGKVGAIEDIGDLFGAFPARGFPASVFEPAWPNESFHSEAEPRRSRGDSLSTIHPSTGTVSEPQSKRSRRKVRFEFISCCIANRVNSWHVFIIFFARPYARRWLLGELRPHPNLASRGHGSRASGRVFPPKCSRARAGRKCCCDRRAHERQPGRDWKYLARMRGLRGPQKQAPPAKEQSAVPATETKNGEKTTVFLSKKRYNHGQKCWDDTNFPPPPNQCWNISCTQYVTATSSHQHWFGGRGAS